MTKEKMISMLVSFTQENRHDYAEQVYKLFTDNAEQLFGVNDYKSKSNPDLVPSMSEVINKFKPYVVDGEKFYNLSEVCLMMAEYSLINEYQKSQLKTNSSIEELFNELEKDKSEGSYYYSWQANIAMAFKDTWEEWVSRIGRNSTPDYIHQISNEAAKRFLDLLIKQHET